VIDITVTASQLGYDPQDFEGHTVVVHASNGDRVACGVLGGELCSATWDDFNGTVGGTMYCINGGVTVPVETDPLVCACYECDPGWEGDNCADAIICGADEFVFNHECTLCPDNTTNAAGDDSSGSNTVCEENTDDSLTMTIDFSGSDGTDLLALVASIENLLAEEGIVASVTIASNSSYVDDSINATAFTVEFSIEVQAQSGEQVSSVVSDTSVYLSSDEFAEALQSSAGDDISFENVELDDGIEEEEDKNNSSLIFIIILIVLVILCVAAYVCYKPQDKEDDQTKPDEQGLMMTQQTTTTQQQNTTKKGEDGVSEEGLLVEDVH